MTDNDKGALGEIARAAFQDGKNVSETLRAHLASAHNTPEIIELSYEMQAGTYVEFAQRDLVFGQAYAAAMATALRPQLQAGDVILDVGSGELTTLSQLVKHLDFDFSKIYACDISEARLSVGKTYAENHMGASFGILELFKADFAHIPLADKSIDITISNHALEPNGGREIETLAELFRVTKRKLVLFEPYYEGASDAAKARMDHHAYIRGLEQAARSLGAVVESVSLMPIVANPLNPTACFVISL